MSDSVLVNGKMYSRTSCKLKRDGEQFFGWDTIEFGQKRERGLAYGSAVSSGARGRTRGRYTANALVIGFHQDTHLAVLESLANEAPDGLSAGETVHNWSLTIDEGITPNGLEPQLHEFLSCTWDEDAASVEDSAEHTVTKDTFTPLRYKLNGITMYDQSQEG